MKRNLLLLAVTFVAVLLFTPHNAGAQCSADPNDLGICDTFYVETFNCDHQYTMGGIFDSVRVACYVTHDSNTFYWQQVGQWVQDSIAAFVVPFNFWDVGCADSVILPLYGRWNNTKMNTVGWMERSIFRHITDDHTGLTTYNRFEQWAEVGEVANWTPTVDMEGVATDGDSGHYFLSVIPVAGDAQRWYEGSKVLLFTLTFLIYGLSPDPGCDTSLICIDSTLWPPTGHLAFTRYDAVNYTPRHFLRVCDTIFIPPNFPPECTQIPGDKSHNLDGTYTSDQFTNFDPDGQVVLVTAYVSPAGQGIGNLVVNSNAPGQTVTGTVDYDVLNHCLPGPYQICIVCTDDKGAKDTCCFKVDLTNGPPTITCPGNVEQRWDAPFVSGNFATGDPDGDNVTVTIDDVDPTPAIMPTIVESHVEWTATEAETCITYTITLKATDRCQATNSCTFTFHAIPKPGCGAVVTIGCPEANPGEMVEVPIMLNADNPIGGFELEVEFDYIALCFLSAERGDLIDDMNTAGLYDWEYFTYRLLPCPVPPCQKYKILLYGQADLPNIHTGVVIPASTEPQALVVLKFQVAFNELLRGFCIPVKFEFEPWPLPPDCGYGYDWDCAENTLSDDTGDRLLASDDLTKFNRNCCHQELLGEICLVHFTDGCVCIPTVGPTTCKRGDVNYNHMQYEVADAVLFARYFVYGLTVFSTDPDIRAYQICATDANADGRPLMLADLIYLIRVIQRDAVPFPKLGPSSDVANIVVSEGRISVECASAIGGLLFEFEGAVTPTLLSDNMEILANQGKVLVWSSEGNSITGVSEVISASGELVSVIAVDREGRELATTITTKVAPSAFALYPAYPNPFNPYTNLSFTLPSASAYSLKIYNVAGQLVRSYEGMGQTGLNVITWNGKDNAGTDVTSGVYFFKLFAGSYTATNKMVLMK